MLGPILPGWYVGLTVNYTDSTDIKEEATNGRDEVYQVGSRTY